MRATAPLVVGIVVLTAALVWSHGEASSPGEAQESVLPALLAEVRGLRAAMEQMASVGPRVQLALGRLQLQEQRINSLVRRLETVRDALNAAQRQHSSHQDQLTRFEVGLRTASPTEREELGHMIETFKRDVARSAAEVQRLTGEESSVAADIGTEQARWTDFNQRLEELERALGRR